MDMIPSLFVMVMMTTTLTTATTPPQPAYIRLALYDWSTIDGTDEIWDGRFTQGVSAQFILAANHFNQRRVDLIPDLSQVQHCNKFFDVVQWCESAGNPRRATDDVLWMLRTYQPHVFAGFGGADDAATASPLLQAWNDIPVVCHWASADQLSDKNVFPLFARTIPADVDHANMLASLIQELNFNEVTLLWLVDGKDMASELSSKLQDQGQRAYYFEFLYGNTPSTNTIDDAVRDLAALKLNVIICATWALQLTQIADAAAKYGLLTDENQWIFTYLDRNPTQEEFAASTNLTRLMHGSFRVGIVQDSTNWKNYLAAFDSFTTYRQTINSIFPPHGAHNSSEKCKNRALDFSLAPDYFSTATSLLANEVWGYSYDAVIALGIAVCAADSSGPSIPNGHDIYDALMNAVNFAGLSGNRVAFVNTTGNRDATTAGFKITNWVAGADGHSAKPEVVGSWNHDTSTFDLSDTVTWKSGKQGLQNVPQYLTRPLEDGNYLPDWARALGYAEMIIVLISSVGASIWLVRRGKTQIVKLSQPIFMRLICLGAALLGAAILPLTFEFSDAACMAFPWLLVLGLGFLLSPILIKSIRVAVMWYHPGFRHEKKEGELKYVSMIAIFILIECIILLAWSLTAPLVYRRFVTLHDQWGNPVNSYGACVGQTDAAGGFMITLLSLNAILAVGTSVVSIWLSAAPERFHEARWTAFAAVALGQCYLFGIPLVFAVNTAPTAMFLVLSSLCFVSALAILGSMFVPKMVQDSSLAISSHHHSGSSNDVGRGGGGGGAGTPGIPPLLYYHHNNTVRRNTGSPPQPISADVVTSGVIMSRRPKAILSEGGGLETIVDEEDIKPIVVEGVIVMEQQQQQHVLNGDGDFRVIDVVGTSTSLSAFGVLSDHHQMNTHTLGGEDNGGDDGNGHNDDDGGGVARVAMRHDSLVVI